MRFVLPLLLLATLTGCTIPATTQTMPEQTESASAEPSQTMDPMESETMDPMETESMEETESEEPESSASPTSTATATPTQSASPTQSAAGYTMAEVAKRNTQTECWVAIDGGVYDLTDWIRQHPGGSGSIRALCGTDGTDQFISQHGGESRPSSTLDRYYLGPLVG